MREAHLKEVYEKHAGGAKIVAEIMERVRVQVSRGTYPEYTPSAS